MRRAMRAVAHGRVSCEVYGWDVPHYFFFQAEDGIRDYKVTGVQTCALPISNRSQGQGRRDEQTSGRRGACEPAFKPRGGWEGHPRKARASNRTREIRPSGIIGGLGKRRHGGTVNPSCNRKSRNGNPPPKVEIGRAHVCT